MVYTCSETTRSNPSDVTIRAAEGRDVAGILEILNHQIIHSDALWSVTPETLEQRRAWLRHHQQSNFPVLVAVSNDAVVGYGSFGPFRPREGYAATVEHSVYVAPGAIRRGIGRKLVQALMEIARDAGYHVMIGAITESNVASIALHRELGFEATSALPQVGRKFDRWLNLVFMYRILDR